MAETNAENKGKLKKWRKRVENGEIQDGALFKIAFGTFGLTVWLFAYRDWINA